MRYSTVGGMNNSNISNSSTSREHVTVLHVAFMCMAMLFIMRDLSLLLVYFFFVSSSLFKHCSLLFVLHPPLHIPLPLSGPQTVTLFVSQEVFKVEYAILITTKMKISEDIEKVAINKK